MTTTSINSELVTRTARRDGVARSHRLPLCRATGLARYRDRHQARHGATARLAGTRSYEVGCFACPDCGGYHLETIYKREPVNPCPPEPTAAFADSLAARKRRYILVDIENPTLGAKATGAEVARLWTILKQQAPGIAPHDHVVVGAARMVVRKYRAAIDGPNVKWVVGADAADGADRALLAAIDLRRVVRDFDELVIVSGDHSFAGLARRAKQAGLSVQVITVEHPQQRSVLSRKLAAAADTHTLVRLSRRTDGRAKARPIDVTARRGRQHAHDLPIAA